MSYEKMKEYVESLFNVFIMINDNDEYCKNVDETISEKMKKSGKKLNFSDFFGRYGVKPPTA